MGLAAELLCQLSEGTRTVTENEAGCPCLPEMLHPEDTVLKLPKQPLPGCRLRSVALQEERCLSLPPPYALAQTWSPVNGTVGRRQG